jgi:hypothetical protein
MARYRFTKNVMDHSSRYLAFHGAIVLLIGLLCGAPFGKAIKRGDDYVAARWRVAHVSLPIGATLMFAVAALLPGYAAPMVCKWLITWGLIVSSYAFCVSLPIAGLTGHRGLAAGKTVAAQIVYLGNVLGAIASLVAALALIYAGFVSL